MMSPSKNKIVCQLQFFADQIKPFLGSTKLDKKTYSEVMPIYKIRGLFSDLTEFDIYNAPHWEDIKSEKEAELDLDKKLDHYTIIPHLREYKYFRMELNGQETLLKPFGDKFFLGFPVNSAKLFLKSNKKLWEIADILNQLISKKLASTYVDDTGEQKTHYEKYRFDGIEIRPKEIIKSLGLSTDNKNIHVDIKNAISSLHNIRLVAISGGWGEHVYMGPYVVNYKHHQKFEFKDGKKIKINESSRYILNLNRIYFEGIIPTLDKNLSSEDRKTLFSQRQYFTPFEISPQIKNQLSTQELIFLRYLEACPDLNRITKKNLDVKLIRRPFDEVKRNNGYHFSKKSRQTKKTIEMLIKFKKLGIIKKTIPSLDNKTKRFEYKPDIIEIITVRNQ